MTQRTADSVRSLLDLAPERATVIGESGEETVVDAATLSVGDMIVVRPGERIGADGQVTSGISDVDQASITGEPLPPVLKHPGDEVFAGTLNGTGGAAGPGRPRRRRYRGGAHRGDGAGSLGH